MAFDAFEPIGSRTTPDLLAFLITLYANTHRKPGSRPWLPQDVLHDPLAPRRLTEAEEGQRTRQLAADYRRLRAERLAKAATMKGMDGGD